MLGPPLDRRAFLCKAGLGAAAALLPLPSQADSALIARRVFFENPEYRNVRLSPDGKHLAYLAPLDGVRNLWVAPIDAPKDAQPLTRATDRDIAWEYRWAHTNRHLVFFRDHDGDENWRAASVDMASGAIIPLTPERGVKAYVQESDHKFPTEMLLGHNQRDPHYFDLFRADLLTEKSEVIFDNREYYSLFTDSAFRLRLVSRVLDNGAVAFFERRPDGTWAPFTTVPIGDVDATELLDFSADGGTLYLLDSRGRDKAVLMAYDMASGQSTVLAEDPDADISQVAFVDRTPVAAMAMPGRARWHPVGA